MIALQNVSFSYEKEQEYTLKEINVKAAQGECLLLTGESGCGKTTFIRLLNGLIPHYYEGQLEGSVMINGKEVRTMELYEIAALTGSVFQNPKSQFFTSDVYSELNFICENIGLEWTEIERRVAEAVKTFSIENLLERSVMALSGGQKQRIACAACIAASPSVFVFDEPSSNLDAAGIALLRENIKTLKAQGKTIVIAEHRLYYLKDIADRVLHFCNGHIVEDMQASFFFSLSYSELQKRGLRCTSFEQIQKEAEAKFCGNAEAKPAFADCESPALPCESPADERGEMVCRNFFYTYKGFAKKRRACLQIENLTIPQRSITALIGENGAGKTTFAKCLCGIYKNKGRITIDGKEQNYKKRLSSCFMVMQDVNHQLFTESVSEEILLSMEREDTERVNTILSQFDLLPFADRHPVSLSGGQKQRTAVASAVVSDRTVLIFDEPTSGLDFLHMQATATELKRLAARGCTVLVVTHDVEFIMSCCTFIVEMQSGIIADNYPLSGNVQKLIDRFEKGNYQLT